MMDTTAAIGLTADEIEKKRKERMARFGEVEVQEALKSSEKPEGSLANRRKSKLARKL